MRSPEAGPVVLTEEEAAYALASLLAGADGTVTHAETRRVEGEWLRFAATRGLLPVQARQVAQRCRGLRATMGAQALLDACQNTLRGAAFAKDAVRMALQVAHADGKMAEAERAQLERILVEVGLDASDIRGGAAVPPNTHAGAGDEARGKKR